MVKDTVLYDRLEISSDSTEGQIKKAFNKLSKLWHPDKHPDDKKDEANKKFQEISQAKEILLDNEKRKIYDELGMDMFKPENQGFNGDDNPFGGANPFEEFGNIFGGGFPFNSMGSMGSMGQMYKKGPENIVEKLNVSLEQLYNEDVINFTYKQKIYCVKCDGEGSKDGKSTTCPNCKGKGIKIQLVRMGPMIQQTTGTCHNCSGKGRVIEETNKCETCNGKTYIYKDKTIQIPLKSGLSNGDKITLSGKGNLFKDFKTDLILTIDVAHHLLFKRNKLDLYMDMELKLFQALFGFEN